MPIKYPHVEVNLIGQDSNVYNLLGIMVQEMRRAQIPEHEITRFKAEALKSDYDHFLCTCTDWVTVR